MFHNESSNVSSSAGFTRLKWWPHFPHKLCLSFTLYRSCFSIGDGTSFSHCAERACVQKETFSCVNSPLKHLCPVAWNLRVAEPKRKKPPQERFKEGADIIHDIGSMQR